MNRVYTKYIIASLIVLLSCSEGVNNHRGYVISQSRSDEDIEIVEKDTTASDNKEEAVN